MRWWSGVQLPSQTPSLSITLFDNSKLFGSFIRSVGSLHKKQNSCKFIQIYLGAYYEEITMCFNVWDDVWTG